MRKIKTLLLTLTLVTIGFGDAYVIAQEISNNTTTTEVDATRFVAKKKCRRCDGTGKVDDRQVCNNCQGQGCGVCDWTGYRTVKITCPDCDGEGKITTVDR